MAVNHSSVIENLEACRDLLLFTLTDEFEPPEDVAEPLWAAYNFLVPQIEQLKKRTGR